MDVFLEAVVIDVEENVLAFEEDEKIVKKLPANIFMVKKAIYI